MRARTSKCCSPLSVALFVSAALTAVLVSPVRAGGGERAASRPVGHPAPPVHLYESSPTLQDVLDRHVEACGGEEAFAALASRVLSGTLTTDLPTWDPPVYEVDSVRVYSVAPASYLVVYDTPDGTGLEGSDGAATWKVSAETGTLELEPRHRPDSWLIDPRFCARLREHFPGMAYLGETYIDGERLHVVDVDGEHLHRLYFDAESGLLARIGYNTRILTYGSVDGVLIPWEVEHSRKGGSSTYRVATVVHNVQIDDAVFSAPEGGTTY